MTEYTADNMVRFLGNLGTDEDAARMGEYLENQGWEMNIEDGEYHAYKDGQEMTEQEWHTALRNVFGGK